MWKREAKLTSLKKLLAFLHSTPTRLQATQYVSKPSRSSNAMIDMDLKTILLIVLGLLVGLTSMTLLIFYRRRCKPPASCKLNKSYPVADLVLSDSYFVVMNAQGKIGQGFYQRMQRAGNPATWRK